MCYSLVILAGCILIQMGPDILVNSASRTQPSGPAGTMRRRSLVGSLEDKLKGSRWRVINLRNSQMALAKGRVQSGDGRQDQGEVFRPN